MPERMKQFQIFIRHGDLLFIFGQSLLQERPKFCAQQSLLGILIAVSYTHLDVYKRQVDDTAFQRKHDNHALVTAISGKECLFAFSPCGVVCIVAVSYTHL